jgi:transposase
MVFIRKIKKKSGTYLAKVESYWENGKTKQKVIKYLGKEVNEKIARRVSTLDLELQSIKQSIDVQAVHHISKKLGITNLENPYWLSLVYSQLLENKSISKLSDWLQHTEIPDILGLEEVSSLRLYDSLTKIQKIDFDSYEDSIYNSLSKFEEEKRAAVIDVTDTYFEGDSFKIKRRKGKDGKTKKLIQVGLAVTRKWGFPIMHQVYEGNLSDKNILKDLAMKLKKRGITSIILDRGMLSPASLTSLLKLKYQTIAGLTKTPTFKKDFLEKVSKDEIYKLKNRVQLVSTAVYIKTYDYKKGKLIICYNPKTEYVRKEQSYQKGKETDTEKYAGFSLIYHNTNLENNEVVKQYYEKDIIERAFKQLKGVLNLRPIRVWLENHVEGHVKICYLAYSILSYLNYKLRKQDINASQALQQLKYGYKATINDTKNKHSFNIMVPLQPKQKKILQAIGIKPDV